MENSGISHFSDSWSHGTTLCIPGKRALWGSLEFPLPLFPNKPRAVIPPQLLGLCF